MNKGSVVLGYWNIRGLGQPIRYLLKYTGTDFREVRYIQRGAPSYSKEEWLDVKFTLGLDFPNLPYLIDGDVKITQSNAIMTYIGRKHDLGGRTDAERATVDMLANVVMDLRNKFHSVCYDSTRENWECKKLEYIKEVEDTIKRFSDYLADKDWLTGDKIAFPDFHLYEMLDAHRTLESSLFHGKENLMVYMKRFEDLPAIKDYRRSSDFIKNRLKNPRAVWGSDI